MKSQTCSLLKLFLGDRNPFPLSNVIWVSCPQHQLWACPSTCCSAQSQRDWMSTTAEFRHGLPENLGFISNVRNTLGNFEPRRGQSPKLTI